VSAPAPIREIRHPATSELDLATVLRTTGDPLRLGIVRLLDAEGELTCGEISERIGLPTSTCSYHLRLLREAGVTRSTPAGTERRITLRVADLEGRFPGLLAVLVRGA
jgi:DNA-binding transcriptional ArsR family regulator